MEASGSFGNCLEYARIRRCKLVSTSSGAINFGALSDLSFSGLQLSGLFLLLLRPSQERVFCSSTTRQSRHSTDGTSTNLWGEANIDNPPTTAANTGCYFGCFCYVVSCACRESFISYYSLRSERARHRRPLRTSSRRDAPPHSVVEIRPLCHIFASPGQRSRCQPLSRGSCLRYSGKPAQN